MSAKTRQIWDKILPKQIAEAYFEVVGGDCSKLHGTFRDEKSVWGEIAKKLLPGTPTAVDRMWTKTAFENNKKGIKDIHYNLCVARNEPYIPIAGSNLKDSCGSKYYCYCRNPEPDDPMQVEASMIECTDCQKWYHGICVKIKASTFPTNKHWSCPFCRPRGTKIVPKLFRTVLEDSANTTFVTTSKTLTSTPVKGASRFEIPTVSPIRISAIGKVRREMAVGFRRLQKNPTNIEDNDFNSTLQRGNSDVAENEELDESDGEGYANLADRSTDRMRDRDGPLQINKKLKICLSNEEWFLIEPKLNKNPQIKTRGFKYRMNTEEYGNVLQKAMKRTPGCTEEMRGCTLKFNKHKVYEDKENNILVENYIIAYGECKKSSCKVKYVFTMQDVPNDPTNVNFCVAATGILEHDLLETRKRHLKGTERDEVITAMKNPTMKPSIYRRQLFISPSTDKVALDKRDFSQVHNKVTFQKTRSQALASTDLDKDIIVDLCKRKLEMREWTHLNVEPKGYIQEISIDPFYVLLYTKQQLDIFKRLLRRRPNSCLHLDATGTIVSKLPEYIDQKRLFYYALCVTIPEDSETAMVPICEFITNSHDASNLGMILQAFFRRYRAYTKTKDPTCGVKFVQTDDSKALISAVQLGLGLGPIQKYLKKAWKSLISREPLPFVHHICRGHASKFLTDKVNENFNDKAQPLIHLWKKFFLFEKDMWGIHRRIKDIIILTGKEFKVVEVSDVIKNFSPSTSSSIGPEGYPWDIVNLKDLAKDGPIYCRSPFGKLALELCHKNCVIPPSGVAQGIGSNESFEEWVDIDKAASQKRKNPYYSPDFLEYLIINIFPYTPLFNHALLYLNNMTVTCDTNAVSESWFAIMKITELSHTLPQRLPRFVVTQEPVVRGRLEIFDTSLKRLERSHTRVTRKGDSQPILPETAVTEDPEMIADDEQGEVESEDADELSVEDTAESRNTAKNGNKKKSALKNNSQLNVEPENAEEGWNKKKKRKTKMTPIVDGSAIHGIHRIPYGGTVKFLENPVEVYHSCNVDTQMQIFYTLFKLDQPSHDYLELFAEKKIRHSEAVIKMFGFLDRNNFNKAKEEALFTLLNLNPANQSANDLMESEERFLHSIFYYMKYRQTRNCTNTNCPIQKARDLHVSLDFMVENPAELQKFNQTIIEKRCLAGCGVPCKVTYDWGEEGPPHFLAFALGQGGDNQTKFEDIKTVQNIFGVKFRLFAFTYILNAHFYAVVRYKNVNYLYNGKKSERWFEFKNPEEGIKFSTLWYTLQI